MIGERRNVNVYCVIDFHETLGSLDVIAVASNFNENITRDVITDPSA